MIKKLALILALALGFNFAPMNVTEAQATNCLSSAANYAEFPDSIGYYNMYQCYKSAGLQATESTCAKYLQDAIGYYRLSFASSALNSIVKYDTCRATLPKPPSSTNTSTGTSTSTGNSTGVVSPGCSAAPDAPILSYKHTLTGLIVTISPAATGVAANRVGYVVTYYDSVEKKWLPWSAWSYITSKTELKISKPTEAQTKIAIDTIAQNSCGNSARARIDADNKGILIFNPPTDEISQVVTSVNVGVSVAIDQLASTLSGQPATIQVLTPKTCQIVDGSLAAKTAGTCSISMTSAGSTELASKTTTLTLKMLAPTKTITCYKKGNSKVTKKVTAVAPKCPTGYSTKK